MKYKKGYKLLFLNNKHLQSCLFGWWEIDSTKNNISTYLYRVLYYYKSKWTKRLDQMGPISVFDNLNSVKDYYSFFDKKDVNYKNLVLYEVKYIASKEKCFYCRRSPFVKNNTINFPNGTDFADEVYLLKEVILF